MASARRQEINHIKKLLESYELTKENYDFHRYIAEGLKLLIQKLENEIYEDDCGE